MRTLASLMFSLSVTACSYSAEQIPVGTPDDYDAHVSVKGLSLGAMPFRAAEQTEMYFGDDLTEKLYPVFVVLVNDGAESFVIERKEVLLDSPAGFQMRPISAQRASSYSTGEAGSSAPLFLPGAIYNDAVRASNSALESDWRRKELPGTGAPSYGAENSRGTVL